MSDPKIKNQQLEQRIKELEKDNKILSDFADLSSDWFWEQDADLRFTRFFGLSTEKLQRDQKLFFGKQRWDMPICGLSKEQLQAHIDCCMNHQPFRDFEYEVPGDDGSLQRYSISGTPIYNDKEEFAGFLLMNDDDEDILDIDEYIEKMREDGEWGGNVEVVVASRVYKRNIVVFSFEYANGALSIVCEDKDKKEDGSDLLLSYHGESHYNSVHPIGGSKMQICSGFKSP